MNQYSPRDNNYVVKDYMKSYSVLIRGIFQLVYAGLYLAMGLTAIGFAKDIIALSSNYRAEDVRITETVASVSTVSAIIAIIPFLLIAIAYFIIWFKSRNQSPDSRPDSGITILNVFAILELIGVIIAVVVMVIGTVALTITEIDKSRPGSNVTVKTDYAALIISLVAICIASALLLVVAIVNKVYIGSIRRTAKTTELSNKGAKAHGVISVICAIGAGLSVFSVVACFILKNHLPELMKSSDATTNSITYYIMDKGTAILLLSLFLELVSFAIYVVDAKIAFGYFNHIKEESAPLSPHMSGEPPYMQTGVSYAPNEAPQGYYPPNAGNPAGSPDDDRTVAENNPYNY